MSEAVITLKGIQKSYGKHQVLEEINLQVNKGDIYGLVGKNGSGKTTIFKVILGLSEYNGGEIVINGRASKMEGKRLGSLSVPIFSHICQPDRIWSITGH